ncbi:putative leucine-rich repeat-containing protein DDB_G0290503 [Cimex lectularius]|uniref:Uncharacterized protein n=1 Tax=Cimex lectularius TaxID=79782 RepID=A0A8I6RWH3_CIMLE|nr:putative leucine-rich repeat-containing protein DDB_G0290503 [Cimex lectularius]XP_014253701.1 putative leucine-rich repeat-containing protein DDB_G0290503 [Cimex lectularius]
MDLFKRLGLLIVFSIITNHSASSPSSIHATSITKEKYQRHADQSLHSTLVNIDDRLRTIESIHYSVKRHEISLDRILNKVESIDSRSVRMQTILEMKLDALSQAIISTEFKHEWLLNQLRKYESNQERLSLKMNSLEVKLDDITQKTQLSQESFFNKIEDKQDKIQYKINELTMITGNLKQQSSSIEQSVNKTNGDVMKRLKEIEQQVNRNDELEKLTVSLNGIHSHLNQSDSLWTQNDGPGISKNEKMIDYIKGEINAEVQKLGNKIHNMYHEIWQKTDNLVGQIKDGFTETNQTQKIIVDDLKNLLVEQRDSENFIDLSMDKVLSVFHKRLNDIQRKLDNNFQNIASVQSLFLDSCQRIQDDESDLDTMVTEVLEKILDLIINRTSTIEKQSVELLEGVKSHNIQITRLAKDTKKMVMNLAEGISLDHKNLDGSIMDLAERADMITTVVQEMQDQMYEWNDTSRKSPNLPPAKKCVNCDNFISYPSLDFSDMSDSKNKEKHIDDIRNLDKVHYGQGVVKVITEFAQEPNITRVNSSSDVSTGFNATVASKENNKKNTPSKQDKNEIEPKIPSHNESNKTKQEIPEITEEVATQLMLSFIKLIREKILLRDFLNEKLTGQSYQSITDMIQHLKPIKTIPREFIRELDQYDDRVKFDKIYSHNAEPMNYDEAITYDDVYS